MSTDPSVSVVAPQPYSPAVAGPPTDPSGVTAVPVAPAPPASVRVASDAAIAIPTAAPARGNGRLPLIAISHPLNTQTGAIALAPGHYAWNRRRVNEWRRPAQPCDAGSTPRQSRAR